MSLATAYVAAVAILAAWCAYVTIRGLLSLWRP